MSSNQVEININTYLSSLDDYFHQLSDELDDAQLDSIVGGESPIAASRFGITIDGVQIASFSKAHHFREHL